jgi:hypothetical protein
MKKTAMRRLFFLATGIIFLSTLTAWAGPVDSKKAQEEAAAFVSQQRTAAPRQMQLADSRRNATAGTPAYYVFNIDNGKGFVIVSGDDRTNPILGYSDEGAFDAKRMPANMKAWLDGYAEQLQVLSTMDDKQAEKALSASRRAAVATRNSIAPLTTTKWDQATPYWNECPQFMNSDDPADGYELPYTGCVATSMSQIMYFYKQPAETLAEIPSYQFTVAGSQMGEYSTVTMDAQPVTKFDWDNMRETYTGAEDEVYTSAVAHLMLYAGCSVKMQYGLSASGAYTDDIPKGFKYFGYGSKLAFRNDYTQEAWDNLVYSELAEGRPMIYNGTAGSGGGHSFVCDGYEYGNYFHINWGWGGMGNGYFQLSILNPSASGIGGSSSAEGYNMKQNIVYNIIPNTATPDGGSTQPGDEEVAMLSVTGLKVTGTTTSYPYWERDNVSQGFSIYKNKTFQLNYADHVGCQKRFDVGLALYDGKDYTLFINRGNYATALTSALGSYEEFGKNISDSRNAVKFAAGITGHYKIVPMYLLEGTTEWKPMKESDRFYLDTEIDNTTMSFVVHPIINLSATNFDFTGNLKVGGKVQVNVTIQNNSTDRFFGDIYLDFGGQQIDEYSQYTTVIQAEVLAGQSNVVTFNVSPQTAGTKTVKAMLPGSYSGDFNSIGSGSVTIAASEAAEELNLTVEIEAVNSSEVVEDNTHGTLYDSHVQFKATITNHADGEYNKYVIAPLFICQWDADDGKFNGSMVTYKQQSLSLAKNESKTLYFDFDNLAAGSIYSMNLYARNNVPDSEEGTHLENIVQSGESKFYAIKPGIITWNGDGTRTGLKPVDGFAIPDDVAAISLEGLGLSSVTPNGNPNTLYFLGDGEATPDGLSGKNVVKGSTADNIVLVDGYDFYTPQTITADAISYERTFAQGHHNGVSTGWSTITLPFAPTTVTNATDNKTIDWFRSSTDTGKQFWLCDFYMEDGADVTFRNAPTMEANVPYIVAVPDNYWGSAWDLRGKRIVWSAENAVIKPDAIAYTSGQEMLFGGTTAQTSVSDAYLLNSEGSMFQSTTEGTVAAFHAYFTDIDGSGAAARSFSIRIDDGQTTALQPSSSIVLPSSSTLPVYNLSGQHVTTRSHLGNLRKGVYIVDGKKLIVK